MIPGSANPLLLKSAAAAAGGYQIERSLRFNSSDSAFCSRTPAVAGNRKTWTWAGWVKRSQLGTLQVLFGTRNGISDTNTFYIGFESDDTFVATSNNVVGLKSSSVYRDASAWYHVVVSVDTSQATSANRVRIYINGVMLTTFSSATYPSLDANTGINQAFLHEIGRFNASTFYFPGYLADIHFIDGQALTPSSFTEVSATTGQLIPKAYAGTYTGNSFWLKFNDNSAATATTLGKDSFLLGNNWTPNNLSTSTGGPTSVAAASGALPLFNTTDTYGTVKGTGTRTDSNSSSISLALPMDGANNGTTFTDESATIKGSGSAKTINRFGDTKTSTATSKYYGSSGYFDGSGDYLITSSSSDFTLGSGSYTIEFFVNPSSVAGNASLVNLVVSDGGNGGINIFRAGSAIVVDDGVTGGTGPSGGTLSANVWQHIAIVSNGTTTVLYIDGIQTNSYSGVTGSAYSPLFAKVGLVGGGSGSVPFFTGYLQDLRIYKGVAKYTSNFNPPNSTQNPTIAAGNDSLVDTPTSYGTDTSGVGGVVRGNYCTWNPLFSSSFTYANGNLDITSANSNAHATIGVSAGKWYWEATPTTVGNTNDSLRIGVRTSTGAYTGYVRNRSADLQYGTQAGDGGTADSVVWQGNTTYGLSLDCDNNQLKVYKANSLIATVTIQSGQTWFPWLGAEGTTATWVFNWGARAFAYTAPSGFKALVDTNLGAPVVALPNTVMDVALWTGNATARTISGLNFSPDLVWIKNRSTAQSHTLYDTIRGATKALVPNATDAELTLTNFLTAFTSDGFSIGTDNNLNGSGNGIVAWTWDAGTSTVSNTAGSITSQVRANASAGFSIATLTTPGSGTFTVGHGLNVAPSLVICKARNQTFTWIVYHRSAGAGNYLVLNTTAASAASATIWQNTNPSSTIVYGDATNWGTADYVMYSFAPVDGYSSMGSFVTNGADDNVFVYTGFRPRWIMWKRTDGANSWGMVDTARNTYNVVGNYLLANASDAEANSTLCDILSNGFKMRTSGFGNGQNYIYFAVAESPFQYARAR